MKMTQLYLLVFAMECSPSTGLWTRVGASPRQRSSHNAHQQPPFNSFVNAAVEEKHITIPPEKLWKSQPKLLLARISGESNWSYQVAIRPHQVQFRFENSAAQRLARNSSGTGQGVVEEGTRIRRVREEFLKLNTGTW